MNYWLKAAIGEHASIASFSRFSLQLLAVGALPDLIRRSHLAAIDEIRHAELSFGLASYFAGYPISPGEYKPHSLHIVPDIYDICISTAKEGCLSETLSTLQVALDSQGATEPVLSVLKVIIDDESRHAVLAWNTIQWCLEKEPGLKPELNEILGSKSNETLGNFLIDSLRDFVLWNKELDENKWDRNENTCVTQVAKEIFSSVRNK